MISRRTYLIAVAGAVIMVAALVALVGSVASISQATAALRSALHSMQVISTVHASRTGEEGASGV